MSSNYDVLSIVYDIWIGNTQLDTENKSCVNSVEIKETVEGSDSATIVITDPNFLYINDGLFIEDNPVKITIGWDNTTYREEFNGYISVVDIDFENTGVPRLTIHCMDETHIMNRQKKDATFSNCTSADIVKRIVQGYGFSCVVDSDYNFTVKETITQSNQTDIDFITKLANDEVYPFTARLVGRTFYYVKMGKIGTPVMDLTYKNYPHEIISFSPRINKETRQVEISSSTIDTSSKGESDSKGEVTHNTKPSGSGSSGNSSGSSSSNSSSGSGGSSYVYDPEKGTWTKV